MFIYTFMMQKWYVILNPVSGNFKSPVRLKQLKNTLEKQLSGIELVTTTYKKHEFELTTAAIKNGFRNFICIGGDGTLHTMVNAIMRQNEIPSTEIRIGVIPVGTGNDWVKTYGIPKNTRKAINIIKNNRTILQDVGSIQIENQPHPFYFNNVAGVGFDGLVVKNHPKFKKFGSLSYLFSTLYSYRQYINNRVEITLNEKKIVTDLFVLIVGIGKLSGGGMQLTDYQSHRSGTFDISLIKKIDFSTILKSISKVFKGDIRQIEVFDLYKAGTLSVTFQNYPPMIQADGELLGQGNCRIDIISKAIQFIVP